MGKSISKASSRKRKFRGINVSSHPPPRRGPPALFVTCESGREKKCQLEALELIHHYYYKNRPPLQEEVQGETDKPSLNANDKSSEEQPLSLEEELSMLRKGAAAEEVLSYAPNSKRSRDVSTFNASSKIVSSMKPPFTIYDTGMRGVVCILCTLPGCEMVPYDDILTEIRASKGKDSSDNAEKAAAGFGCPAETQENADNEPMRKALKGNGGKSSDRLHETDTLLWDPVDTVKCIMRDATNVNKVEYVSTSDELNPVERSGSATKRTTVSDDLISPPPPGSRFITRILPIQATCYSSVEEIKAVSMSLLKRWLPKVPAIVRKDGREITFKLDIKRRLCSHLVRDQVIEAVTPLVLAGLEEMPGRKFSVNLSDPDFSIRVEACKGLCGVSILPREAWYKNFNFSSLVASSLDLKK